MLLLASMSCKTRCYLPADSMTAQTCWCPEHDVEAAMPVAGSCQASDTSAPHRHATFQCSSFTHALLCLRVGSCSVLRQGQPGGPVVSRPLQTSAAHGLSAGTLCQSWNLSQLLCQHTAPVLASARCQLAGHHSCILPAVCDPQFPHFTPCRFDQLGYTLPYKVNVADFILDIASSDVYTEDRCVPWPCCSR